MTHATTPSFRDDWRQLTLDRVVLLTVIVSALGYFVDIFDLLLFSIVRVQSLKDIGVPEGALLDVGVRLINIQMAGLLVGGIFWGVLGDKMGRLTVLLGSILLYSLANIANGFVHTVEQYAVLRFIGGLGLAGELGLGVTLVSELLPRGLRGWGTTMIAVIGLLGAALAATIADKFDWRTAYIVGGVMGLGLLFLRVNIRESGLYQKTEAQASITRGKLRLLFGNMKRLRTYIYAVMIGAPFWAMVGIFMTFTPEFAKAFGMTTLPTAGTAVLFCYMAQALGNILIGGLSQRLQSRRKAIGISLVMMVAACCVFLTTRTDSVEVYYATCALLGFGAGYWAMFVQVAAEQFGTNLRATAATSIPNIVRGLTIPMTAGFHALIPRLGVPGAGASVMALMLLMAFVAVAQMRESFHTDLDYIEG